MERVGAVGESLFELPVDAEPFQGGGEVAGGPGGPELAGRAEFGRGLLGDQQAGADRVRPAAAAVPEPARTARPTSPRTVPSASPTEARTRTNPASTSVGPEPLQFLSRDRIAELAQTAYGCRCQSELPHLHPDHRLTGRSGGTSRILKLHRWLEGHRKGTEHPGHGDEDSAVLRGTRGMPHRRWSRTETGATVAGRSRASGAAERINPRRAGTRRAERRRHARPAVRDVGGGRRRGARCGRPSDGGRRGGLRRRPRGASRRPRPPSPP